MLPPPSSASNLAPPPLEVRPLQSFPSSPYISIVGNCAPGVTSPRSLCTRPWWLSDAGDARSVIGGVGEGYVGGQKSAGGEVRLRPNLLLHPWRCCPTLPPSLDALSCCGRLRSGGHNSPLPLCAALVALRRGGCTMESVAESKETLGSPSAGGEVRSLALDGWAAWGRCWWWGRWCIAS